MERYLLSSVGLMFLLALGAFLLFVPLLSIATVALIVLGLGLMFWIGFRIGRRSWPRMKQHMPLHTGLHNGPHIDSIDSHA
jgi:hypothetical protein